MDPYEGSDDESRKKRKKEEKEEDDDCQQHNNNNNDIIADELRKQIVAHTAISEQLDHISETMSSAHHHSNTDGEEMSMGGGGKRWTPTPIQAEMLESIYKEEGIPTRQKIKDNITAQLEQHGHGHISEINVYAWFLNRRGRSKRKLMAAKGPIGLKISDKGMEELIRQVESLPSYGNLFEHFGSPG